MGNSLPIDGKLDPGKLNVYEFESEQAFATDCMCRTVFNEENSKRNTAYCPDVTPPVGVRVNRSLDTTLDFQTCFCNTDA